MLTRIKANEGRLQRDVKESRTRSYHLGRALKRGIYFGFAEWMDFFPSPPVTAATSVLPRPIAPIR
ncbi:8190_t:CDS:2, partial [Funneliformis caledonium]